eukprot:scaffold2734_cov243-Ochromonas_danica.AAC.6
MEEELFKNASRTKLIARTIFWCTNMLNHSTAPTRVYDGSANYRHHSHSDKIKARIPIIPVVTSNAISIVMADVDPPLSAV